MTRTDNIKWQREYVSAETVANFGQLLFGPSWEKAMASSMGVTRWTIRKWKENGAPAKAFKAHLTKQIPRLSEASAAVLALIND